MSHPKEPHYFSTDIENGRMTHKSQYLACFVQDNPPIAIGEASTLYLYSKVAIQNILKFNPNAKFIGYKNLIHKSNKYEFYPVNDQDRVLLGKINIKIIHTPGHFPDSLCYLMENIIFTGDTLFVGRTGRTISANASTKDLYYSIYDKILSLPGNTLIYPGHDYGEKPTISLKENIKISPLLQAKSEKDFIERMANYEANR